MPSAEATLQIQQCIEMPSATERVVRRKAFMMHLAIYSSRPEFSLRLTSSLLRVSSAAFGTTPIFPGSTTGLVNKSRTLADTLRRVRTVLVSMAIGGRPGTKVFLGREP